MTLWPEVPEERGKKENEDMQAHSMGKNTESSSRVGMLLRSLCLNAICRSSAHKFLFLPRDMGGHSWHELVNGVVFSRQQDEIGRIDPNHTND